jgi:hypothetical protein
MADVFGTGTPKDEDVVVLYKGEHKQVRKLIGLNWRSPVVGTAKIIPVDSGPNPGWISSYFLIYT